MSDVRTDYLREIASDMRASAQKLSHSERLHTLEMAAIYERLAERIEDRDQEEEDRKHDFQ